MNRLMSQCMDKHAIQVNHEVMDGIAVPMMEMADDYIHNVLLGMNKGYHQYGLEYLSYERCDAYESHFESTKIRNNKRTYDLAKTDIYLLKLKYRFTDPMTGKVDEFDRYVYMPFVGPAGIFHLSGSMYHLAPVASDKVISPETHSIFVRLLSSKVKFHRTYHSMVVNGVCITTQVCWAPIYKKLPEKRKIPATTKALTTTAHYLFARFGFKDAFLRYAGYVPQVSAGGFNSETHPPSEWILVESASTSTHVKPRTYIGDYYTPTKLQLAIPKDMYTTQMASLVEGFFYVVDHFPDRIRLDTLEIRENWMVLIGHIVFSGMFGENKLFAQIQEHFGSLENSVDPIIVEKLHASGYNVNDFYDLIAMVSGSWNSLVAQKNTSSLKMYGKTLELLYYVLYPITSSIFTTNFKLAKFAQKKKLTLKYVMEIFNRNFRVRAVFDLSSKSIVSETVSYSGDHKYPKITSKLNSQEDWNGQGPNKKKRLVVGPEQRLDTSQIASGSVLALSKSNPSPDQKMGCSIVIDKETNMIVENPALKQTLELTQQRLDKK